LGLFVMAIPAVRFIFYSAKAPQKDVTPIRAMELLFFFFGMVLNTKASRKLPAFERLEAFCNLIKNPPHQPPRTPLQRRGIKNAGSTTTDAFKQTN